MNCISICSGFVRINLAQKQRREEAPEKELVMQVLLAIGELIEGS